jgi:outer membrane protein assembly factor BamB
VQTGVGTGEGWLAVGLRGGRIGISRCDGTSNHVVELGGLKAVDATPVVQGGRVFFLTNENTIECLPVDSSVTVRGWPQPLPGGAATELLAREGRLVVVDRDFVLHCWEQSTGALLWTVSLDSAPSGQPTIERRMVHVGTLDGRVLVVDAADGRVASVLRSPSSVATRVLADRGIGWFGAADGNVRAVDLVEGRVLWTASVGRALADGELALGSGAVVAIDQKGDLVAFHRATGERLGQLHLDGAPQRGLKVQGNRAFVQLRRPKVRNLPAHDVLQAVALDTMTLQWEYADQGVVPGLPGVDDLSVVWPTANSEVVLFR